MCEILIRREIFLSRFCRAKIVFFIIFGHHPQAGGAAVHGVELVVIWEPLSHYTTYKD